MKLTLTTVLLILSLAFGAKGQQDSVKNEQWNTSFSGMKYLVLKEGNGKEAYANRRITVRYKGWLEDGTLFDSSGSAGFTFVLGRGEVIKGWDEGVRLMSEGSIYRFIIPPKLAYGKKGAGEVIPPEATLIFEIELLKVENL